MILITTNLAITINLTLIGGILPLIERKYLGLVQRRVGPKFTGYKGRLQFLADALKMFLKEKIVPHAVSKEIFFLAPAIFLSLIYYLHINMYWSPHTTLINTEFNLVLIPILNLWLAILIFLVGFFSKNKFSIISSMRSVTILSSGELLVSAVYLLLTFGINSFSASLAILINQEYVLIMLFSYNICIIILSLLVEVAKSPFDLVEAETELVTGFHTEYGSFLFALFYLGEYFHIFFSSSLILLSLSGLA